MDRFCNACKKNRITKYSKTGLCIFCARTKKSGWCSGLTINNITFLEEIGSKKGYKIWKFKCHCGNIFENIASKVKLGRVKSCGCSHAEHCRKLGEKQKGKNNPSWIEDRTKTSLFIRGKDFNRNEFGSWQYKSRKYKIDNNYTCKLTGFKSQKSGDLHVHHLTSVVLNPLISLDENNLILVKTDIHRKFHKLYGKITANEEWNDFVGKNKFIKGTA